eukprot:TRINITY_DN20135_c0_g1_i1.p1 TRINITY_DN20135_c0_g1~~TRINITY_DN20135_c0_g1_i1.p1  ORF type:complete len:1927 (+),score=457.77 TRINITY_DN20135_c0_g1_i1:93-5873(+)
MKGSGMPNAISSWGAAAGKTSGPSKGKLVEKVSGSTGKGGTSYVSGNKGSDAAAGKGCDNGEKARGGGAGKGFDAGRGKCGDGVKGKGVETGWGATKGSPKDLRTSGGKGLAGSGGDANICTGKGDVGSSAGGKVVLPPTHKCKAMPNVGDVSQSFAGKVRAGKQGANEEKPALQGGNVAPPSKGPATPIINSWEMASGKNYAAKANPVAAKASTGNGASKSAGHASSTVAPPVGNEVGSAASFKGQVASVAVVDGKGAGNSAMAPKTLPPKASGVPVPPQKVKPPLQGTSKAAPIVSEARKAKANAKSFEENKAAEAAATMAEKKLAVEAARKSKVEEEEKRKKAVQERDNKAFKELMPALVRSVSQVTSAINSVSKAAEPILAKIDEEVTDAKRAKMIEIEASANKAQEEFSEVKKLLATKLQAIQNFASETKQTALKAFQEEQVKLNDAQQKLTPLKRLNSDYEQRGQARKALSQIAAMVAAAETHACKAAALARSVAKTALFKNTRDTIVECENLLTESQLELTNAVRSVELKMRSAQGVSKDEVKRLQDKAKVVQEQIKTTRGALKPQLDELTIEQVSSTGNDLLNAAEQAMKTALEAEDPFLKGQEVLPAEEAVDAFKGLDEGSTNTSAAVQKAKLFVSMKTTEVNAFTDQMKKERTLVHLGELTQRLDVVSKRLDVFRKDTSERKAAAVMAEVSDQLTCAIAKLDSFVKATEIFDASDIETIPIQEVKDAIAPSQEAEKAAVSSLTEVKVALDKKARTTTAGDFAKLNQRLLSSNTKLAEMRKLVAGADKLIKLKEVYTEQDARVEDAEKHVTVVQELGGDNLSDEALEKLQAATEIAQKSFHSVLQAIQPHMPGAPASMKPPLSRLVARIAELRAKVDVVKAATHEQREAWVCRLCVAACKEKLASVVAALAKTEDAEIPFLKGVEVLPSSEGRDAVHVSEDAARNAQSRINDAKVFITEKQQEIRKFAGKLAKSTLDELGQFSTDLNRHLKTLVQFQKDTEERNRTLQLQMAGELVEKLSSEMEKSEEDVKPLLVDDLSRLGEAEANKLVEELTALKDNITGKVGELGQMVNQVQLASKTTAVDTDKLADVQKKLSKLMTRSTALAKLANAHMHDFLAKELLREVEQQAAIAEKKLAEVTEAAAPLMVEKGESFLVASRLQILSNALQERMETESKTKEDIFASVNGGKAITSNSFVSYLGSLSKLLDRESLDYTDEQRQVMFKSLAGNADTLDEVAFSQLFQNRFVCIREVAVTSALEVGGEGSSTIATLAVHDIVEAKGAVKIDVKTGLMRVQVRVPSSEDLGWVSLSGNKGAIFLERVTPFYEFCKAIDAALVSAGQSLKDVDSYMAAKEAEFSAAKEHSAKHDTRADFAVVRKRATSSLSGLQLLRAKIAAGKKDYTKREEADARYQSELAERRMVEAIVKLATEKVMVVESELQTLEQAGAALTCAESSELKDVKSPLTVAEAVEKGAVIVTEAIIIAREAIREQLDAVGKSSTRPYLDGKTDLNKLQGRVITCDKRLRTTTSVVKARCQQLAIGHLGDVGAAFRAAAQKREAALEDLFREIACGKDKLDQDAFCKYVLQLPGLEIPDDHVALIFKQMESDGMNLFSFLKMVQQFFVCVKAIAFTNLFTISGAKTIRRIEEGEIIEMLEGPTMEDGSAIARIRGRALTDGVVGWVSVKGNQGTPFLKTTNKPCYKITSELRLQREVGEDSEEVCVLKPPDVFEILEGPCELQVFCVRAQGKALSDGACGWATVRKDSTQKVYKVVAGIVLTDSEDVKGSKPIRKLEAGEILECIEGPVVRENEGGITRIKAKTVKGGDEGWVTLCGSKGTSYVEESTNHFMIHQDVMLEKEAKPDIKDKESVRLLKKGEIFEASEIPTHEGNDVVQRVRGRSQNDASMGWVTLKDRVMRKIS